MKRQKVELVGHRFGKLLVISKSPEKGKNGEVLWDCLCDCGNSRLAIAGNLRCGTATSCGCESYTTRKKHGMTKTTTFKSWDSMKQRCLNENAPDYPRYGGRGITICNRWLESFNNFISDLGERPEGTSLDRIDVNGNYEPSNCRWATRSEQQRNKSNTIYLEWRGEKKSIPEWADITGITRKIITERIKAKWFIEDALTKPNRKQKA